MPARVLVALPFARLEQVELIERAVEEAVAERSSLPTILTVSTEREALDQLRDTEHDLLIAHLHLAPDRRSPLDETEERAVRLVGTLRQEGIMVPAVLLAPRALPRLFRRVNELESCTLLIEGEEGEEELASVVRTLLYNNSVRNDHVSYVEITLTSRNSSFRIKCRGSNFFEDESNLSVRMEELESLKKLVPVLHNLSQHPDWEHQLRDLGGRLFREIFSHYRFSCSFGSARFAAGGLENLRIRFNIERSFHPLVLEALAEPDEPDQPFWMLRAPIYRRLRKPARWPALFKDRETRRGPINCLIIEATAEGFVRGRDRPLEPLTNVPDECAYLSQLAREHQHHVEHVRVGDLGGDSFRDRVKELLTGGRTWHLVHYGGHSWLDAASGRGYVFFPGDHPEQVWIAEFAEWLKDARFVYLSSCRSSEEIVTYELVRHRIPAALGFRWDLDDCRAAEFARSFYDDLLTESKSIETAFFQARKAMHLEHATDRIWAAPLLFLQTED